MGKAKVWSSRLWRIWEYVALGLVVFILFVSIQISFRTQGIEIQPAGGNPLEPLDLSSPRSTLLSFLTRGEEFTSAYNSYETSPSFSTQRLVNFEIQRLSQALDTRKIPPAEQGYLVKENTFMLWDVLCRIELPPFEFIPDKSVIEKSEKPITSWTIPNTDIVIELMKDGPQAGKWLFSDRTVLKTEDFYELTRFLPYNRENKFQHAPREVFQVVGGWMFPPQVLLNLPDWLKYALFGQAVWKWLAMFALYGLFFLILAGVFTWAWHPNRTNPGWRFFRRLSTPASILAMLPALYYFLRHQIIARGDAGQFVAYTLPTVAFFIALAWGTWLVANLIGELVIMSPRIKSNSTDAHLIRLGFRVSGLVFVIVIIFQMGTFLGIPLYGLIAGAGVGTLAIALAAQSTLENFIGSLNLYADRPVSTGDFCIFGTERGTVEEIGLRSTRIRGIDRTVHTIPNANFSKMELVNYTKRDKMLFRHFIRLRLDTPPDQLRYVLAKLRELIVGHPRLEDKPARARLWRASDDALEVELFAYVNTDEWPDFLAVQEDLLIRVLEIVDASGTSLALPSSTTYLARATSPDEEKAQAASAAVAKWREESRLPFPDLDEEARSKIENKLPYPQEGSSSQSGQA